MRPSLLIAANFLRENRWAIVLLIVWSLASGTGAALTVSASRDDSLFFLKQQAAYSVFFTVFLAASALHNQRRSRRILAVLSKGVGRSEYLAGIVLGFLGVSAVYSVTLGITAAWTFSLAGIPIASALALSLMLFVASGLAGAISLFYSTFLSPLFTLLATSLTIGGIAWFGKTWPSALPAYELMESVLNFSFHTELQLHWSAIAVALFELAILWLLASLIFGRKDLAVSLE